MTQTMVITPTVHYFGSAVALLTTANADGTSNITPISSTWSLGDRYVVGMLRANHGAANLERTGEVVLNLPDAGLVEAIERLAPTTGSDPVPESKLSLYRHEPDKWGLAGLTPEASETVVPWRIRECPVQIEARLESVMELDETSAAYHLRIARVHAYAELVVPGTSHIDLGRWKPLYYTFRHYFAQGEDVGRTFKAEY